MLLLLTGAYIPKPLRKYLFDRDVVFLNFNFIPFNKLPLVYDFYIWIKFDHYNSDFNEIGVESGSTVVNNLSTTAILILFSIIHLVIGLLYWRKKSKTGVCGKITRAAWKAMSLTAYIRLLLENSLYMMLC